MAEQNDNTVEEWRAISGFDGYEASSMGRIRSYKKGGPNYKTLLTTPKILHPWISHSGYEMVSIFAGQKKQSKSVHRLVCLTFHGPSPSAVHQVNHIDFNKRNNQVKNLEWATPKENKLHALKCRTGNSNPNRDRKARAQLNGFQVRVIRRIVGLSGREIGDIFSASKASILSIRNKASWHWLHSGRGEHEARACLAVLEGAVPK